MKPSIQSLRAICQTTRENEYYQMRWFEKNVSRRLSIYFTSIFISFKLSANQVTLISFIVGLLGALFLVFSHAYYWLIGFIFIYLFLILDCCDGEIARYNKTSSRKGEFWDSICGNLIWSFILCSSSIGIYLLTEEILAIILGMFSVILLFLHYQVIHNNIIPNQSSNATNIQISGFQKLEASNRIILVIKTLFRLGRSFFGNGAQGIIHGLFLASIIDLFIPLFFIGPLQLNARFIYFMIYSIALFINAFYGLYHIITINEDTKQ